MKRWGFLLVLCAPLLMAGGDAHLKFGPYSPQFRAIYSEASNPSEALVERSGGFVAGFLRTGDSVRNKRSTGFVAAVSGDNVAAIGSPLLSSALQTNKADGLWLGPTISFLPVDSDAIDTWTDLATPIKTANAVAGPNGANNADRIEDNDGAAAEGVTHTAAVAATTDIYVATVWYHCTSGHNVMLSLTIGAGRTDTVAACSTTWKKMRVAQAGDGATLSATITISPARDTFLDIASTGIAEFWRVALWRFGSADTGWVSDADAATVAVAVDVNADRMDYSGGFQPPLSGGTLCVWMNAMEYVADTYHLFSWDSTDDFSVGIVEGATDRIQVDINTSSDDGQVNSAGVTIVNNAWHQVCVTVAEVAAADNRLSIYLDGAEVTYNTTDRAWTDGESTYGTNMGVGGTEGASKGINGYVSRPEIWQRELGAGTILSIYDRELSFYQ